MKGPPAWPTDTPRVVTSPVHDRRSIFAAAGLRNFGFGFLSVILAVSLRERGVPAVGIGAVFTVALLAGGILSALAGSWADRLGRRRLLRLFAGMMAMGGVVLFFSESLLILFGVALVAGFSPSGKDIGPMLPLEQAALAEVAGSRQWTSTYATYNLVGSLAASFGALSAALVPVLVGAGLSQTFSERLFLLLYAVLGVQVFVLYLSLSPASDRERPKSQAKAAPLGASRKTVYQLTGLFAVDAAAGGLVVQGIVALWFRQRYGVGLATLGPLFFGVNLAAALSFLMAKPIVKRLGLLRTMVLTHLPSNILLALVALAPNFIWAAGLLVARGLLSQLDVPTRQAYTMAVVTPEERSAAAGLTASVRGIASSLSPLITGWALAASQLGLPFILAGGAKAAYDLALFVLFRRVPLRTPEG